MRSSRTRWIAVIGTALVLGFIPLQAAGSFEVTPFYGYRLGGEFSDFDTSGVSNLEIDDGDAWGAILTFNFDEHQQIELLYSHQQTSLRADGSLFSGTTSLFDLDVDNWQLGGSYTWGERKDPVRGFLGFSLGVTSFDPQSSGFRGDSQFAFSFYGGAKMPFNQHVGLRLQGQWVSTYISSHDDVFCDPFGFCYTVSDSSYLNQFELSAGIAITF